jgi:hypothetical protein
MQSFSKVAKIVAVAAISNRALSSRARTRLGNRGYIRDFGKTLRGHERRLNRAALSFTIGPLSTDPKGNKANII